MALLWCDGFDHYGTDETNLTDGPYATAADVTLTTAQVATGTHSILIGESTNNSSVGGLRKVLPASVTKMGLCMRLYFPGLPESNTSAMIAGFQTSNANLGHVSVFLDSNGRLLFYKDTNHNLSGEMGTLIAQSDPVLTANAWHHVELQVFIHATTGWVRAAVNGVHVYQATGLDTLEDSSGIVSIAITQPYYGTSAGINNGDFYMDDLYMYDFVGDSAVDTDFVPTTDGSGLATSYIGELQVMYLPPNGDTAETDWVRSTGSNDYEVVDETSPNDNDYIYSTAATDLSEFDLTDLPEDITYVRGLQLLGRMSKADAGACMIKFGMKSVAATADSAEFPITVEPTYWWKFQNTDPDSSARWTRASLNAAKFRITRSV
jgi:hypothetical protein